MVEDNRIPALPVPLPGAAQLHQSYSHALREWESDLWQRVQPFVQTMDAHSQARVFRAGRNKVYRCIAEGGAHGAAAGCLLAARTCNPKIIFGAAVGGLAIGGVGGGIHGYLEYKPTLLAAVKQTGGWQLWKMQERSKIIEQQILQHHQRQGLVAGIRLCTCDLDHQHVLREPIELRRNLDHQPAYINEKCLTRMTDGEEVEHIQIGAHEYHVGARNWIQELTTMRWLKVELENHWCVFQRYRDLDDQADPQLVPLLKILTYIGQYRILLEAETYHLKRAWQAAGNPGQVAPLNQYMLDIGIDWDPDMEAEPINEAHFQIPINFEAAHFRCHITRDLMVVVYRAGIRNVLVYLDSKTLKERADPFNIAGFNGQVAKGSFVLDLNQSISNHLYMLDLAQQQYATLPDQRPATTPLVARIIQNLRYFYTQKFRNDNRNAPEG